MTKDKQKNSGFTVVELMIATTVFAVVLLVFLSALLRISQLFYKGVNLSNTQETARNINQTVSNDIQYYHDQPDHPISAFTYYCIGNHRYSYNLFQQYTPGGGSYGLLEEDLPGCPDPSATPLNTSTGKELLSPGMQLNKFNINCMAHSCTVTTKVVFYSDDPTVLLPTANDPNAVCSGPAESTQYCATAEYNSTVVLQGTY